MKVKKIMTKSVGTCGKNDNLARAVEIMWQKDCGIVPVVDKKSNVVGTVTDRDVAVSVFLQNKTVAEIIIGEIISGKVITCLTKDDVEQVLKLMKKHKIKRLPVTGKNNKLKGIISITDILLAAADDKSLQKKVLKTLEAIGKPRPIVLKQIDG